MQLSSLFTTIFGLFLFFDLLLLISAAKQPIQSPFSFATTTTTSLDNPPLTYIPPIGLGLWQSKGKAATKAVHSAFSAGYRHLDSAAAYDNEVFVGKALNTTSSLPRSAYWLTSKLWNTAHHPADVEPALRRTLADLQTDYLDLYLMHWPISQFARNGSYDNATAITTTWHEMESLLRKGLTRHIGLSNCSPAQVQQILDHCQAGGICPVAHEFETHPYLQQAEFVAWHRRQGIQVIAYSPLANMNPIYRDKSSDSDGDDDDDDDVDHDNNNKKRRIPPILEDPFWHKMAKQKHCTVAQAVLAWGLQRGTVVIPKSVHEARIIENWGANNIRFSSDEMEEVAKQDRKLRFNDPSKAWGFDFFEGLDGAKGKGELNKN